MHCVVDGHATDVALSPEPPVLLGSIGPNQPNGAAPVEAGAEAGAHTSAIVTMQATSKLSRTGVPRCGGGSARFEQQHALRTITRAAEGSCAESFAIWSKTGSRPLSFVLLVVCATATPQLHRRGGADLLGSRTYG